MSRFARVAALLALVAALCVRAQAAVWTDNLGANLDPARVFDPAADSMLAALFTPVKLSPISIALFNAPDPETVAIAAPLPQAPSASSTVNAVTLRAYVPAVQLPSEPLQQPSVMPAAPAARAQLPQAHIRIADSAPPAVHFGNYTSYTPATQSLSEDVHVPVRIGGIHFSGMVSGAQQQNSRADAVRAMQLCGTTDEAAACPYLHDERTQNFAAGTNFNVRAGNTQVNLQISGSVGRVSNRDAALYQYVPLDPDPQLDGRAGSPEDTSLLYYPGLTQMVRHGVDARVAVPISPALTVGLQYDRAHYQGNYATLFAPGLDARKDTYLGNVTYQLPNSSSLLTLSARQYRYQDGLAPLNLTETRADLSFTVKF